MIFVTVGTTDYDFSRLFRQIDKLVTGDLMTDVTAQIGQSRYQPLHYMWQRFFPAPAVHKYLTEAEYIICHAGSGTLNECLELKKKVIVVPRQHRYQEAPDDHQLEMAQHLSGKNRVLLTLDINDLTENIRRVRHWTPAFTECQKEERITNTIKCFIQGRTHVNDLTIDNV